MISPGQNMLLYHFLCIISAYNNIIRQFEYDSVSAIPTFLSVGFLGTISVIVLS